MAIDLAVQEWRKAGKHLPPFLRDFHDQKDVFKMVHDLTVPAEPDPLIRRPSWVEAQVYVIDTFLWCMARHGYTLQRSRARLPFESLADNIAAMSKSESAAFNRLLSGAATANDGEA